MKPGLITLVVGLSLAIPAWLGLGNGSPTNLHPFPFLSMMIGFLSIDRGLGLIGVLALWPTLFFLWSPRLFRGDGAVPRRTYALWLITTVLSVAWFVDYLIDWQNFSRRWHDFEDIQKWRWINAMSGAIAILLGLQLLRIWVQPAASFASNLILHWTMFLAGMVGFPPPPDHLIHDN